LLIRLLSDLSTTDAGKKAMSSERGFMRLIADAFHSTPAEERQHVKALLDNVCEGDPDMVMEAARCSMFQPLVSCLTQG
jgi:predicted Zn-dependent protease with MMP-like domain